MIQLLMVNAIIALVLGLIIGLLAERKKRNAFLWSFIFGGVFFVLFSIGEIMLQESNFVGPQITALGILFWLIGMISLVFLPHLCPKCKQPLTTIQRKKKICPVCGNIKNTEAETKEVIGWQCPECGEMNNKDMIRCVCGYEDLK